ncbi:hypothetical protein GQX73_g5844 [Xylaria multiplex]|uniref:Uncharacterized protein n=1 Tax=Xylaria multiplex TaxID=323545 RepID=A0A7C8IMW2_9PEZI|nr:hypothetical protein GQX73_g5844 [Xylaria multiplex]
MASRRTRDIIDSQLTQLTQLRDQQVTSDSIDNSSIIFIIEQLEELKKRMSNPRHPSSPPSRNPFKKRDLASSSPLSPSAEQEQLRLCLEQINLLYSRLSYDTLRNNHHIPELNRRLDTIAAELKSLHIDRSLITQPSKEGGWSGKVDQDTNQPKVYPKGHLIQTKELQDEFDEDLGDTSQPLKVLHTLSLRGLEILADTLDEEEYIRLVNQLRTWGIGILHGPLSLDHIFMPSAKTDLSSVDIGFQTLVSLFIKMLLNIKYLIVLLAVDSKEVELYLPELANTFNIPSIQDELKALEWFKAQLKQETTDESIGACDRALPSQIQSLYDMLPAIRTLRHVYASKAPPPRVQLRLAAALVEENAELGDRIAESLRATAKGRSEQEGSPELGLAMLLSKESEKLRELRITRSEQTAAPMVAILSDRRQWLHEFEDSQNVPTEENPAASSVVKEESNTGALGKEYDVFRSNDFMGRIEQIFGVGALDID